MVLKEQFIQVRVFAGLGVLFGLGAGGVYGPIYGWRLGLILSTVMGIVAWSFYFDGGWWVIFLATSESLFWVDVGCLAGATVAFALVVGVGAVRYIRFFVLWKAPKSTDGIFGQRYLHG
jgi:hypothetical protein